jgi:hypothetical protein
MFISSPPEKESKFQKLKKEKGSFWAFHGSSFANVSAADLFFFCLGNFTDFSKRSGTPFFVLV